jgi:uncharacterized protein (TIGR03083 family)
VEHAELVAALDHESSLAAQGAEGALDSPVSTCPGWRVSDVIGHLGGVYSWASTAVRGGGERPSGRLSPPDEPEALLPWFAEMRAGLLDAFDGRDPADPAWVFTSAAPHTVGWWARRQALETAIHRYDVEKGAGRSPSPVDPPLAVEGVDEFLMLFLPIRLTHSPVDGLRGTFHAHSTDAPGEWSLDFAEPDLTRREHSKADTAIRGPASGLFLWTWNRVTPEEGGLETFGDAAVISGWRELKQ